MFTASTDLPNALSCRLDSDVDDEEMAQSAHLMTLGLCRISSNRIHQQPSVSDSKPSSGTQGPGDFLNDKQTGLSVPETLQQIEEDGSISCILCQVVVSNRSLLDVHLKCHNGPHEFRCPQCGVETQEWVDMERHWRGHSKRRGAKSHKCTACHKVFQCEDARRAHEQKHKRRKRARTQPHSVLLQCTSCQEWCQSMSEFELHKHCHCTGGGFKCPLCDFIGRDYTADHVKYVNSTSFKNKCFKYARFTVQIELIEKQNAKLHSKSKHCKMYLKFLNLCCHNMVLKCVHITL